MTIDISKAAAALGRRGGKQKSAAKTEAARKNGKLGGRPMLAKYKTTDGQPDETMSKVEALALIAKLGARVAPSYTSDDQRYEVYEVYGVGETADDYPDGDPYADSIWVPVD